MAKALGGHLEMLLAVRGGGGRCAQSTFALQSPMKKGHLSWVLVIKDLVGLHRTIQLQLLVGA